MAVDGVGTNTTTTQTGKKSAADTASLGLSDDLGNFLKLLTTQLQNQDPTAPLDANQFTQQIVSFSQVEQSINSNKNLEKLVTLSQNSKLSSAIYYVGMEVEIDDANAELSNSEAEFSYTLDKDSVSTTISVIDEHGKTVYTASGDKTAGKHNYTWTGRDSDGNKLPDGSYRINVSAIDSKQNSITTSTTTKGVVKNVTVENGEPVLTVNGRQVTLDKVKTIEFPDQQS